MALALERTPLQTLLFATRAKKQRKNIVVLKRGWCLNLGFSVNLCVLRASVVVVSHIPITMEAQRTQRFTEK